MSSGPSERVAQESVASLKPHAQVHLLSPVDKCKVCGEPAAKHIHYGAMSCFSCRAFFRRSIQNKTANTYVCRRNKDCQINLKTRKNCQFCRYERCLGVGMKPSWVLSPDERERRFRKNKEKKETKLENADSSDSSTPLLSYEHCTKAAAAYVNNIKQEFPTTSLLTTGQHREHREQVNIKSEMLYSEDLKAGVRKTSPPVAMCVEVPPSSDGMYANKILPRTSLISPVQHQNFYVYSPTSQHRSAATPVISTREDGARAIIVTCGTQFSGSSCQSYSALPSRLSIGSPKPSNSPSVLSRSVIVKSQYFADQPPTTPTTQSHTEPAAPWHTPVTARQIPSTATGVDTTTNPVVAQASSTIGYYTQRMSPFQPRGGRSPAMNEMGEESEYEDSVYSRSSDDERSIQGFLSEPEIKFTEEEYENLKGLVQSHDERYKSVNFGEELIKEMIMCSMFGIPISTSAAISGYRLTVERITRIANHLDCFADLPLLDQSSLLKENADLLVSLRGAIFFDSKKKGVNQVLISMGIDDLETIKTMFSPLMKESRMKHIDYKIFNSIQKVESNNSVEQRYNFLQGKVAESICDDITTILLTYIILFSVDFCTLQDSRRIEQLQEQFIRMLERYVYSKTNRKDACHMLASTLNAVTCIREMADIKKSRAINQAVKIN